MAEGLECKELIIQKNKEIKILDTTVGYFKKINVNLSNEISARIKNEKNYKTEIDSMDTKMIKYQVEKAKAVAQVEDQKQRKVKWRTWALGEAGFILLSIMTILTLR